MSDGEEKSVEERLAAVEKASRSALPGWFRDTATLLSPIILAVIGFVFQQTLQDARNEIQENELDIRRIESAQQIMGALFEEDYDEARALQSLFVALLEDAAFQASLTESIDAYFEARFDRIARQPNLKRDDVLALQRTADTARTFDSGATPEGLAPRLHVVLVSIIRDRPGKFAGLVAIAKRITADPDVPDAEIWCSTTGIGYFALTVGRHPVGSAWHVGENVHAKGWVEREKLAEEFYVTRGDHFSRQVWPGADADDPDPCA